MWELKRWRQDPGGEQIKDFRRIHVEFPPTMTGAAVKKSVNQVLMAMIKESVAMHFHWKC